MKFWQHHAVVRPAADWNRRLQLVVLGVTIASGFLGWRLLEKSVIEHPAYAAQAESQYEVSRELPSQRGAILAQDVERGALVPLAATEERFDISVVPHNVQDKAAAAETLAQVFDLKKQTVFDAINNDKLYLPPIVRGVNKDKEQEIVSQGFAGLLIERHNQRVYPEGSLAGQLLGFVNREGNGNYGIEGYYEKDLHGTAGSVVGEKDTLGRLISTVSKVTPKDGVDLELTIDHNIQYAVEQRLTKTVQDDGAQSGQVIVMDPSTGAIIAMAATPTYDPNSFSDFAQDPQVFVNPTVSDVYEPGSIMKPIIMASAIDLDKIEPDTQETFGASVNVQGYTIHTALNKAYGKETMTQVLENSDNVGMVWVSGRMSPEEMYGKFDSFGLTDKTGIDLSGETQGHVMPARQWHDINKATMSFGQGISVTPVQIVRAWAALINGGTLVTPHIVQRVDGERGVAVDADWPTKEGVISSATSQKIRMMLQSVVDHGPYGSARVSGYALGAKSGTAQIAGPDGGYLDEAYTHSFMGFFPAESPKFLVFVKLDRPTSAQFAASTAGPLFADLVKYLANYYDIPPSS